MSALPWLKPGLSIPGFTPTHTVFLDLETFWDKDFTLRRMTTVDYVRDPRFEVLMASVDDGEECVWFEEPAFREWTKTVDWSTIALGCHNTCFDGFVLAEHYDVHPAVLFDTLSMARSQGIEGGVSLDNLATHFGVGFKGHEVEQTQGKRRKDFTPEEWARYVLYCQNDTALCRRIFEAMMEQGFPESELWVIDQHLKLFTDPKLILDEDLAKQFLADERERKKGLLARIDKDKSIIQSSEKFANELRLVGVEPPVKLSPKTKKEIYAFAKDDAGMLELLEHENDEVRWLAEARVAMKSTQGETRAERFLRLGANGQRMPVMLNYYGAHTGRPSAGGKTNFTNLQRTNKKDPTKGMLKKSLIAEYKSKVVAADSGSIEARVNAWLSGHETLLDAFREKRDLYSEMASDVFGRKVDRKKNPEDELAGNLGKTAVLGCGFQMGWAKFAETLLKGPMGNPSIQITNEIAYSMGVDLEKFFANPAKVRKSRKIISRLSDVDLLVHCAAAEKIVRTYRNSNEPIVELWSLLEGVIQTMAEIGDTEEFTFGPDNCLTVVRHGIRLPNGMMLRYPGLREHVHEPGLVAVDEDEQWRLEKKSYSYLGQYGKIRKSLYGGKLCENIVQALARIVVTDQMLHMKATTGRDISLFTYDELVYVEPDETAPWLLARLLETMKTPPSWAPGLPLSVEGGFHQSYGLAKG